MFEVINMNQYVLLIDLSGKLNTLQFKSYSTFPIWPENPTDGQNLWNFGGFLSQIKKYPNNSSVISPLRMS
jgi:hypothetical protein